MQFINYLLDASEELLTWDLNMAVTERACLLAGIDPEYLGESEPE